MKKIKNKVINGIMLVVFFASVVGCKNVINLEKNSPQKAASDYVNNLIFQNNIMSGREADYEIPDFFNEFDVVELDGNIRSFASYSREEKLAMVKVWKEANVEGISKELENNETILSDVIELNNAVKKSIRKASRSVLENQKESFLNNYSKELGRLIQKEEKARNSSSGSSFNQKKITEDCTGTTVCFCFNYGGEQEIADAANKALEADKEITPETIRKHLYHPEVPDVDMMVRTSGEERISGFMLWRVAYAELMFIDKYFPEMTGDDIAEIIKEYEKRNRRFGK